MCVVSVLRQCLGCSCVLWLRKMLLMTVLLMVGLCCWILLLLTILYGRLRLCSSGGSYTVSLKDLCAC